MTLRLNRLTYFPIQYCYKKKKNTRKYGKIVNILFVLSTFNKISNFQLAFHSSEGGDSSFDVIIGCIEDIVIGDDFQEIQVPVPDDAYECRHTNVPIDHLHLS